MNLTQDILLPVLVAAIFANTVILLLVVFVVRGRRDRVQPSATRSALRESMMSTSFVDHSARSTWGEHDSDGLEGGSGADTHPDPVATPPRGTAWARAAARELPPESRPHPAEPESPEPEPTEPHPAAPDPADMTDTLTGLPDQAAFAQQVATEDVRIQRYHRPATVVIFEVAGLDRFIERLGEASADRVIPALADTMRRLARDVDFVARLAPSRFGILLPETDQIAAINYVERVRRACELWLESGAIALELAAGWAGTDGTPTLVETQRLATDRMYAELRRESRRATADRS